jgi:hypothetical protein
MMKSSSNIKIAPLQLTRPHTSTEWMEEPNLVFADGMLNPDPKVGIPLYGPRSLGTGRHKREVHIGFIGTAESVENGQRFFADLAEGVDGDKDHPPFPGCKADLGFRCDLLMDSNAVAQITRQESLQILGIRTERERFEAMLGLLQAKMELLTQKDHPLDYVVLVLPKDLYKECRVTDYYEKGVGDVHRDLRRAFKAMAMQFHKPTQILQESTTLGLSSRDRKLDHKSKIAWNLFTGLYFKVDGLPWGPTGLPPASCFIGVSFFRPLGDRSTLRTSVVQAFDENGEGLVLRGHDFHWDENKHGRTPHLTEEMAGKLVAMVLDRYEKERGQAPQRVVLHKTSRFEPNERVGFEQALSRVNKYDLLALTPSSEVRLLRIGKYPPLRGTAFTVGDISYLYTSGYLSTLKAYPHGHVPSSLQIADHVGDTSRSQILRESLILTKMNWNSANFSGLMPITIRFSRLVGDILREIPLDEDPQPKYKYYM